MFGQLVIGPCGSGKSTYCKGMAELMRELKRKVVVVNLDPSNYDLVYDCDIDIRDLVKADEAAVENDLGPNASQIYCLSVLASRLDWLADRVSLHKDSYFLFDCPGQFELYTDCDSMTQIVNFLTKKMQLVAVTLIDCLLCSSAHSYISAVMMSLSMMIHLELPHVNVLSKIDSLRNTAPELAFKLEYYLKAGEGNLEGLVSNLFPVEWGLHPMDIRYSKFVCAISQVAQDFSLVGFVPLAIEDKELAIHTLSVCDRANGYSFSAEGFHLLDESYKADTQPDSEYFTSLEEKFQEGPTCTACGNGSCSKLLICSACKKAQYCSRDCQKADWQIHKRICTYKQS